MFFYCWLPLGEHLAMVLVVGVSDAMLPSLKIAQLRWDVL